MRGRALLALVVAALAAACLSTAHAQPATTQPSTAPPAPPTVAAGPPLSFANWAAVVVAGDHHSHSGAPSEVFDNARRDVAAQLARFGFAPANIVQFSTEPKLYPDPRPGLATLANIRDGLTAAAAKAPAGCLVYYTSHGLPGGLVLTPERREAITPPQLDQAIEAACADRPTVVVLSACFSGGFVPGLARPNRMIFTAARSDRTSFGCGDNDKYPYFDDCFLSQSGGAADLIDLAIRTAKCVAAKEAETGAKPPSSPQLWIGERALPLLPRYAFPSG